MRAFLALELSEDVKREIAAALGPRAASLAGLRRTAPGNVHLTLRFLGDSRPEQLAALVPSVGAAAARCPPADARIAGLGLFPERGAPRILWLGVEPGPGVLELQQACEQAAQSAGFAPEPRPFRPHLTLGRWRERVRRPELAALELGVARLERLVLFESRLDPRGAVYTPLHTFRLGGENR